MRWHRPVLSRLCVLVTCSSDHREANRQCRSFVQLQEENRETHQKCRVPTKSAKVTARGHANVDQTANAAMHPETNAAASPAATANARIANAHKK
ncbi:uncharacterized protein LOC107218387 [Neodiprion lecontei]|uniref:Uncharacterized protein LOC107218387 n=1 Tax=Neodiprion lecontei TaxID=441921 RepID=A0ABM3GFP6_NEOLC|nr:uncharacterized protein LOC107218387 [Neodiprion lecontei]